VCPLINRACLLRLIAHDRLLEFPYQLPLANPHKYRLVLLVFFAVFHMLAHSPTSKASLLHLNPNTQHLRFLLLLHWLSPCYCSLQMRKAANRLNFDFNKAEDEYIDGDEIVGLGTINKEGSGRLRLVASQQKVRERGGGRRGEGAAQGCRGGGR